MAYPSVTYTFTNGTTASATEVNQNFTDLINGISDGTKDLSISALTVAGTASLNGAVNIGNATSDDIAVNGYITTALIPKADDSYDLGTAALAWQDGYFEGKVYTDSIKALTSAGVTITDDGDVACVTCADGGAVTLGVAGQKNISNAAFGIKGSSSGGFGASVSVIDNSSGTFRFISCGANATTIGGFQFYGTESDDGNTTLFGQVTSAGAWANIAGGSWGTISDSRLKKNIVPLHGGLATILALNPVSYDWRDANVSELRPTTHFIAQEVEAVNPKWVKTGGSEKITENGIEVEIENCKQVNLDASFNAYLVKAIQELSAKLDEANARIAVLEAK
jgi:hypothetical protein